MMDVYKFMKSELLSKLTKIAYVGDSVILLCSEDYVKKQNKDLTKLVMVLSRWGLRVRVINYEDFTHKRGNGCLEDAIKNLLKEDRRINFLEGHDKMLIAWRGISGEPHLFRISKPFIKEYSTVDGHKNTIFGGYKEILDFS